MHTIIFLKEAIIKKSVSNNTKNGPEYFFFTLKNSKAVKIHPLSPSGIETSILRGATYVMSQQEYS